MCATPRARPGTTAGQVSEPTREKCSSHSLPGAPETRTRGDAAKPAYLRVPVHADGTADGARGPRSTELTSGEQAGRPAPNAVWLHLSRPCPLLTRASCSLPQPRHLGGWQSHGTGVLRERGAESTRESADNRSPPCSRPVWGRGWLSTAFLQAFLLQEAGVLGLTPSYSHTPWQCLVHLVRSWGEQWSPAWDPPATQMRQYSKPFLSPGVEAFAEGPVFLTPCLRPTSSLKTGGRRDPHSQDKRPCVQRLPGRQPAPSTAPGT